MKREDKFVMSHRPYAVDLNSLESVQEIRANGSSFYRYNIGALWFRKKRGVVSACLGYLWDYQNEYTDDPIDFLAAHADGRYGGTTLTSWDGLGLWTTVDYQTSNQHLDVLRPMLEYFPNVPPGYDGWWTFRE